MSDVAVSVSIYSLFSQTSFINVVKTLMFIRAVTSNGMLSQGLFTE